ncbi:MAG: EAL domain-containing protein [Thiohalocapsa sp.]|uniref:putative bifunctional diguanylate cyclase/phosphodiesterase n=1 Tax=Thiohalocapsa sp. TaxID=2497641 RepID=UPI0025E4D72E|nr:GGDEF and EAL domain-containing protein [Thiohalocapsa sp.]MCG6941019.1 EAL domain-containing protein [Thiohalocapsa sp.]
MATALAAAMGASDRALLFDVLFAAMGSAVAVLDADGRIVAWNGSAEQVFGYPREQALGQDLFVLLFRPELATSARPLPDEAFTEGGQARSHECKALHRDGSEVPIELTITPAASGAGAARIFLARDLTREKEFVEMFTVSEANFYNVVQRNRSGILVLDAEGVVRFANPVAEQLLARHDEDLWGKELGIPTMDHYVEVNILRDDGSQGMAEMTAAETLWQGQTAYLVMVHDITERKRAEEQVRHLAYHDALTGLPNRVLFHERLAGALRRRRRNRNMVGLLFIDLNGFKEVNDTFGHAAGDLLLQTIGTRLTACLREMDAVARMGGDEFTIILEQIREPEDVERIADKILRVLGETVMLEQVPLSISASIGYAVAPRDGEDAEMLVRRADDAMYAAKTDPGTHIVAYSPDIYRLKPGRAQLERSLRGALFRQEMALHYQPQHRLADGGLVGLEALLRWRHPKLGSIAPAHFIPVLEDTGLILDVGRWVIQRACAQLAEWRAHGLPIVPVAVNVSPRQLADRGFNEIVLGALQEHGLPSSLLRVELAESAVMDDMDSASRALGRLDQAGVALVLDDFGTGYSALGMLRRLPFSGVKIDHSLITAMADNKEDEMLVAGLVAMLHGVNKTVIGEGVETHRQLEKLRACGCDAMQGWLCGPAADVDDTTALLGGPDASRLCEALRRRP